MTNDEVLQERLDKVRNVISAHGERNFYVAFSGAKDSAILSHLIDVLKHEATRTYLACEKIWKPVHD